MFAGLDVLLGTADEKGEVSPILPIFLFAIALASFSFSLSCALFAEGVLAGPTVGTAIASFLAGCSLVVMDCLFCTLGSSSAKMVSSLDSTPARNEPHREEDFCAGVGVAAISSFNVEYTEGGGIHMHPGPFDLGLHLTNRQSGSILKHEGMIRMRHASCQELCVRVQGCQSCIQTL